MPNFQYPKLPFKGAEVLGWTRVPSPDKVRLVMPINRFERKSIVGATVGAGQALVLTGGQRLFLGEKLVYTRPLEIAPKKGGTFKPFKAPVVFVGEKPADYLVLTALAENPSVLPEGWPKEGFFLGGRLVYSSVIDDGDRVGHWEHFFKLVRRRGRAEIFHHEEPHRYMETVCYEPFGN